MEEKLEYRMYGLVPYNISSIQQGIQYGHSVVEYAVEYKEDPIYNEWAINHKTFIILNGGTTNNNPERLGTLNKHLNTLLENKVKLSIFAEPDLGDQLTAITFIVDERVFSKDKYPTFIEFLSDEGYYLDEKFKNDKSFIERLKEKFSEEYADWVKLMGGSTNVFLKEFLAQFKLA